MPAPCSVCSRSDRPRIDEALANGVPAREIERRFGVGRGPVSRHAAHAGFTQTDRRNAKNAQRRAQRRIVSAVKSIERPQLVTAADVADELRSLYGEARELLEAARTAGDARLAQKSLADALGVLTQIARGVGLFRDENVVRIEAPQQRIINVIAGLSDEQIRAYLSGDKSVVPALPSATTYEGEVAS